MIFVKSQMHNGKSGELFKIICHIDRAFIKKTQIECDIFGAHAQQFGGLVVSNISHLSKNYK